MPIKYVPIEISSAEPSESLLAKRDVSKRVDDICSAYAAKRNADTSGANTISADMTKKLSNSDGALSKGMITKPRLCTEETTNRIAPMRQMTIPIGFPDILTP